jgi:hypothetical protein
MAEADGSNPRWVYSGTDFLEASFSFDGRYALLKTYELLDEGEEHGLVRLDLLAQMPPRLLAKQTASEEDWRVDRPMVGGFVSGGSNGERIFLAEKPNGSKDATLRMLDAANPENELFKISVEDASLQWTMWSREPATSIETLFLPQRGDNEPLRGVIISLIPEQRPVIGSFPANPGFPSNGPYPRGDMFSHVEIISDDYTLYSLPLPKQDGEELQATSVFTGTEEMTTSNTHAPFFFGPELFAYVENGSLNARSYDGTLSILLENGVTDLSWGLRPEPILIQFR